MIHGSSANVDSVHILSEKKKYSWVTLSQKAKLDLLLLCLHLASLMRHFKTGKKGIGAIPVLPSKSSVLLTVARHLRTRNQEHWFT